MLKFLFRPLFIWMRILELKLLNLLEVMALADLLVSTLLYDLATFHHNNLVGVFSIADGVRDQKTGFTSQKL